MGAFFAPAESSWGYFHLFCEIFKQLRVPQSIYTDCHSLFFTDREPTLEEQLINRKPTTEVRRELVELWVTLILAHSPQAKGRIERLWNTFQDRLVSELRLAKAKTVEQASVVLNRSLIVHNRRFAQPAKSEPAWRKLSSLKIERDGDEEKNFLHRKNYSHYCALFVSRFGQGVLNVIQFDDALRR